MTFILIGFNMYNKTFRQMSGKRLQLLQHTVYTLHIFKTSQKLLNSCKWLQEEEEVELFRACTQEWVNDSFTALRWTTEGRRARALEGDLLRPLGERLWRNRETRLGGRAGMQGRMTEWQHYSCVIAYWHDKKRWWRRNDSWRHFTIYMWFLDKYL